MAGWSSWESESDLRIIAAAALKAALAKDRYLVRSELRIPADPARGIHRGARLDLAILERATSRIVLVLEVKRSPRSTASAQGERYAALTGAPVLWLKGREECEHCAGKVLEALSYLAERAATNCGGG